MYLDYWKLASRPFEPVADRAGFYPCEAHEAALLKLRYALENQSGAALLVGPSGAGKTLLVELLRHDLEDRFQPVVHLVFPQMTGRDLLVYLAEQLGAPPVEQPRYTVEECVRRLEFLLAQNARDGRRAVVVIDEAHLLEDCGALETLRLLLNFQTAGRSDLVLLLVGQLSLLASVNRLPSLEERVGVKAVLPAFTPEETGAYVQHRLRAAGSTREVFTPDALETIHYLSRGLARQINRLGDLALLVGFADRLPRLGAQQIEAVSDELITVGGDV